MLNSCLLFDFLLVNTAPNDQERIEIFITNKTDETLQIIIRGITYDFEINRVLKNKTKKIKVYDSEAIYIIGGNTQKEYEKIFCNSPGIEYIIRNKIWE